MTIKTGHFELVLLQAEKDESDLFSSEYQAELIQFAKRTEPVSRRAFTMDDESGGGGLIGEFVFKNAVPVLKILGPVVIAYITGRIGRKVKLKVPGAEIEAHNIDEVEKLLRLAADYQNRLESNEAASLGEQTGKR